MWWAIAGKAAQNALGTINTYYNTKLQNKALKYQAAAARNNAKLARMQSESSLRHGERASQQIMTAAAKQKGAQKVGYAANGVDISSRSAQNIMNETEYQAQSDQIQTEANALAQAWSNRLQATNYENQAKIATSKMQSPLGAAISFSVGKFLSDLGGGAYDDIFGDNKQDNSPDVRPAQTEATTSSVSPHVTQTVYGGTDTWDANYDRWRNGFGIGTILTSAGNSGFTYTKGW